MPSSSPVASTAPRPSPGLSSAGPGPVEPGPPGHVLLDDHVVRCVDGLDGRGRLRGGERILRPTAGLEILRQQVPAGPIAQGLMGLGAR